MDKPEWHNFIFLCDIISSDINDCFEIYPNYFIKKANKSQVELIKKQIQKSGYVDQVCRPFETIPTTSKLNAIMFQPLDFENWKYWIVEYINEHDAKPYLYNILRLCELELNPMFHFFLPGGSTLNPYEYFEFVQKCLWGKNKVKILDSEHIGEINSYFTLFEKYEGIKENYESIKKALKDFYHLGMITSNNNFKIIAIFSIIETLLTNDKEGSRISYQLKEKLNLLNNRFNRKINIYDYFNGPDTMCFEMIIEKMYAYRSNIAHGDFIDFNQKLQIIADPNKAYDFLYTLLRRLITHSLKEPQLIKDLRCC